ncbi:MAG: sensor histidine kinase [Actinomycetes bacterium]
MRDLAVLTVLILVVAGVVALAGRVWRRRHELGSPEDRVTFATLHTTALAAPALRDGLSPTATPRAARHLRALLDTAAVAVCSPEEALAWEGTGGHHRAQARRHADGVLRGGRPLVLGPEGVACADATCPIRYAVVTPLIVEGRVVGSLAAYGGHPSAGLVRAVGEVARYVSGQLELAELDRARRRLVEAEVRALRAQISPHFVYNALTAIASLVRTDPDRARELLVEFAEFIRYSVRQHGPFISLAEELRSVEQYLLIEKARFADRLQVSLRVAPEVLAVPMPFLCLQPLVENAVRHGLEGRPGTGHIAIVAENAETEAWVHVEDDGVGSDPEVVRAALSGRSKWSQKSGSKDEGPGIGLANVDARLRQAYGEEYGLVVETGIGLGTKVSMRIPKYHERARP